MTLIVFTALLFGGALWLGVLAARRADGTLERGVRDALREMIFVAPRLIIGVIGAGFTAELLPPEIVRGVLGAESGSLGILLATAAGAILPGGPVLVYAIGGSALLAGAGAAQVIAFVTSWLLYSATRTLVWEAPIMGYRYVWDRVLLSAPFPIIVGHLALLIG